ncbi:MAG: superoxide dismutase [Clostridiales bacterium]|jgi:Fe-Mn family superoxide dismutase|nr:superoxide dismutase [Clostridiales bacterium]
MELSVKNIKYNSKAISEKAFSEHFELYKGYVNKFNAITNELSAEYNTQDANSTYSKFRALKKGESYALDGAVLHELYFQAMTASETRPLPKTIDIISKSFGSFSNFVDDFINTAKSARGWVIFSLDQRTGTFRNFLLDSHDNGIVLMAFPIIVIDMYEHAYFLDYGINKEAYIRSFMKSINWDLVEKQIKKLC